MKTKPYIFPIGTEVWFNAYVDPQAKSLQFLCKGIVLRQPTDTSRVYKVIPIEVYSTTPPNNPKENLLIHSLLGKKIPKHGNGITRSPASWYLSQQKYTLKMSVDAKLEILKDCNEKTKAK